MKPKRIIDMHHHLPKKDAKAYARELRDVAEVHRIEKIVLLGLEWKNQTLPRRNDDVLTCWRECPDLIVPFACIDPDWPADPTRVDALKEQGFVGLKFILPKVPYHHESLYPWYARAEALRMPTLFHLGIVGRHDAEAPDRVDNNLMRPIYLDTIARAFPKLQIIGAHLGNPWYDEAAMSCRWNPNLYFDLSGSTLKKKKPVFLGELLWWGGNTYPAYADALGRNAWEKIVFGSDVIAGDIPDVIADYQHLVQTLELSEDMADAIFYRTGAAILSHAGIPCSSV